MKINILLSDTTKGATTKAIKKIIKNAESNYLKNNIVIVPETKSIIIEKEILNLSNNGAYINIFVYSFVRLLDRFNAVQKEKLISKQSCIILLRKIILDNLDKLECYKKSAKMVGFAEKIYETIAQFKSSNISVDELKLSLSTTKNSLRAKLKDIIFLYEEYEKTLENQFYDDCDKLALISKFAKNNEFLKESNVYVVGFDNITFEMETVLRDLAINSNEITFSCVYFNENRRDKYIQNNELYEKFKHIAESLKYPYIPEFSSTIKEGDFRKIQYDLFLPEQKKFISEGQVKIFKANSQKQELDFVANTILSEISNGKRFRDIGVLVNNLEENLDIIQDCFEVYKIPYFINISRSIDSHFVVRFIILAFELYSSHLSVEKVLPFISNPILNYENYSLFENYIKEQGINYNDFLSFDKFLDKLKSDDQKNCKNGEKYDNLYKIFSNFAKFYTKFAEKIKGSKKVNDYISLVEFLLDNFDVESVVNDYYSFQKENDLAIQAEITNVILDKVKSFNAQLENFLGNVNLSLDEFLQIYKTGFMACKINIAPVSIDCVIVQENTDGFYNISDLFVVGATEGQFPIKKQDAGIILDSELDEAKLLIGKTIEPKIKDINRRERYRIYEILLEPKEKLFISYSTKSIKGKATQPASIIESLKKLLGDEIEKKNYKIVDFYNYEILEKRFVNQVNKFFNGENNLNGKNGVNYYYSLIENQLDDRLLKQLEYQTTQREFYIRNFDNLYFATGTTSVSQIQTYFDCPYKFFALYGLKLKENKDVKISVPDVGTILHRVTELFAKNLVKYKNLSENELSDVINDILLISLEENNVRIEKNKSLFSLLREESFRLCKYLILEQENSNFKIKFLEYYFSNDKSIKLKIDDNKIINIVGKIDRIDSFKDYIRVIDYKTGNIKSDLKSIYFGNKIQLAIYLQAVQGIENKKVAGIFYFPIHSEYVKTEKNSLETYKMTGFILDDVEVVKNMDITVSETKLKSTAVPLWIKIDKNTGEISFHGNLMGRYSENDFNNIKGYVNKFCIGAISEILSGYIEPSPIANQNSEKPLSCINCNLYGFCGLEKARNKFGRQLDGKVDIGSFYFKEEEK